MMLEQSARACTPQAPEPALASQVGASTRPMPCQERMMGKRAGTQTTPARETFDRRKSMAKKGGGEGVYRVIDVIGTSTSSWEDAAKNAVSTASKSLRDLRIAEIAKLD